MAKPAKHHGKWRIRWIDATGKRRSATFTERKTAELALRKAELEAEERRRGLRPAELEPRTFLDASEYWRTHRAPQKRSQGDDLSLLRQLEPHFGKLLLSDRAGWVIAVDQYRATKAHLNKKTVANHLTLLGSILRVAHELGWMGQLPVIRKPRVRLHSTDYSYLRTGEEVARFLRAAAPEGRTVYVLYLTAISTGLCIGKEPLFTAPAEFAVQRCQCALERAGCDPEPRSVAFGTDAGQFARAGIPSVVLGPGSIAQAHTEAEYVEIDQLERMVGVFEQILEGA